MSKAKTKEQYMDDLINKNPQTIIVGEYINARTPTLHRCLIHGNEWNISPDNALKGKQCPDCAKSKMGKARKKSHDEYISQLKKLSYEIVPLEQYNGSKHKIIHYCKIHDYSWSVRPEDVLNGKGCPKCRSDKLRQRKLKMNYHRF